MCISKKLLIASGTPTIVNAIITLVLHLCSPNSICICARGSNYYSHSNVIAPSFQHGYEHRDSYYYDWRSYHRRNNNIQQWELQRQKVKYYYYDDWRRSHKPPVLDLNGQPIFWNPWTSNNDVLENHDYKALQWNLWTSWQYEPSWLNGHQSRPYLAYHPTKSLKEQYYERFGTDEAYLFESDFL